VHVGGRLVGFVGFGGAVLAAATLVYCNVYTDALLVSGDAGDAGADGPDATGGIGWWSGPGSTDHCYSAGVPTTADRPAAGSAATVPPIYLALTAMRLGSLDPNDKPSTTAWQDIGFDLDGVCTQSPTCLTSSPVMSCKPTGLAVPVDGNDCRDNTFGRLEVEAASIPAVGGTYGLNDDAFDCALCVGDYNFLIKISGYNGQADDSQVRVDLYPSPGLVTRLPSNCGSPSWRTQSICFTPDMPFTIRDTAVSTAQGGPQLPDAVVNDPNAYVKDGVIVAQLPPQTLFWFPGYNAPATAFPLAFAQALVAGHLTKAQDGTWAIVDGTIGGRATEQDILNGFQLIGFCPSTDAMNYTVMQSYLHANLDILASGKVDPNTTCDSVSVGIGFSASQATAGPLVHVPDPVACTPKGQGGDGGIEGGATTDGAAE
jgi:hypothetical protein